MKQAEMVNSVCASCGVSYHRDERGSRCIDCRPSRTHQQDDYRRGRGQGKTTERGYGAAWQRLSKRARELQPFCLDCGATDDLTADHSIEAWKRHEAGKTIRLRDIEVVCRRCNSERGAARGANATDDWRSTPGGEGHNVPGPDPLRKAKCQ